MARRLFTTGCAASAACKNPGGTWRGTQTSHTLSLWIATREADREADLLGKLFSAFLFSLQLGKVVFHY